MRKKYGKEKYNSEGYTIVERRFIFTSKEVFIGRPKDNFLQVSPKHYRREDSLWLGKAFWQLI
jgi:hypothetical protein